MLKVYNQQNKVKASEHFHSEEFECGCCHYALIDTKLILALEYFRGWNGGKSLIITSGYRCPHRNLSIGGSRYSTHLKGQAADIQWDGCEEQLANPEWRKALIEKAEYMGVFGIGFGPVFLHLDVDDSRTHLTTWEYNQGGK